MKTNPFAESCKHHNTFIIYLINKSANVSIISFKSAVRQQKNEIKNDFFQTYLLL